MCRRKSVEVLRDMTKVACADGTWNYDPYFHGMANGMIFALSLAEDDANLIFLEAPKKWIGELPLYKIAWRRFMEWAKS